MRERKPQTKTQETPAKIATVDPETNPLTVFDAARAPVDPVALVQAFRYLQPRLGDDAPLSADEKRKMLRTASLSPEFLNAGIAAAEMYPHTKATTGQTPAELRAALEEINDWDDVEREVEILRRVIHDANLKRKQELGGAILTIYSVLRSSLGIFRNLRPYFEEMQRAYQESRKKKSRKSAPEPSTD